MSKTVLCGIKYNANGQPMQTAIATAGGIITPTEAQEVPAKQFDLMVKRGMPVEKVSADDYPPAVAAPAEDPVAAVRAEFSGAPVDPLADENGDGIPNFMQ